MGGGWALVHYHFHCIQLAVISHKSDKSGEISPTSSPEELQGVMAEGVAFGRTVAIFVSNLPYILLSYCTLDN